MYTKIEIEQLCTEQGALLVSIDSTKEKISRDTKVTVRCCALGCEETISKTARNLFSNKNFGCKIHCGQLKGQKIRKTKGEINLEVAIEKDTGKRYTHEQLCNMECRPSLFNICHELKITQYHNSPKCVLIDAIIERQSQLDTLRGDTEVKEEQVSVQSEDNTSDSVDLLKVQKEFLQSHFFF